MQSRKPTRKRTAKRDYILESAARFINSNGVGRIVLGDLADEIGIARKTLYYYVSDRSDLIFQCYQRACLTLTENLAAASEEDDPAGQIKAFIEANLDFNTPVQVAIADIALLPDNKQSVIREQIARLVDNLVSIIEVGIADGVMRPCNAEIAAHLLLGILNWTRISNDWLNARDTKAMRRRSIAAIVNLLLYGFSTNPDLPLPTQPMVEELLPRLNNPFDRKRLHEFRSDQIAAAASKLFNKRGIEATSLDDIVNELGMSKGAIYHYYESKDHLVATCYKRAFRLHHMFLNAAPAECNAQQRMSTAIHLHAQAQMGSLTPLIGQPGWDSLPHEDRQEIARAIRLIVEQGEQIYRDGENDGSIRQIDAFYHGSAVAGSMLWMPWWLSSHTHDQSNHVADEITAILTHGIAIRPE